MKTMHIAIAAMLVAAPTLAGYKITIKNATESDARGRTGQSPAPAANSTICMSTAGEKARIDFLEGQMPGPNEGGYLLTRDAGKTFYMVSPKDKTYTKWDMEAMMGMAGAMGNFMKMQISDPKVEKLLDEPGQPILGYPTRHYKFRTSYRMSMTVMGFKNETTIAKEDETWASPKLDIATLGAWFSKAPRTRNAELDKLIEAEKSKMTGLPLKMLSVQTSTDGNGKTTTTSTSMAVTDISSVADVDAEIPADYKEVSLFEAGAGEAAGEQPAQRPARKGVPKLDFGSLMKKAMESTE